MGTGDPEDLALCAWFAVHGWSALLVHGQLGQRTKRLESLALVVANRVVGGSGAS